MHRQLSILLIVFLIFISPINAQEIQNAATIPDLSGTEKLYGLSLIWQEVNYNFAFFDQVPDLDWNAAYREYIPKVLETKSTYEYYRLLQRFIALLEDGHTDVQPPADIRNLIVRPQVQLRNFDNRAYVMNVGSSLEKQIPVGSEIIKVDNVPTGEYVQEYIIPYIASSTDYILWNRGIARMLEGLEGSGVTITIRTFDGTEREVELQRNTTSFDEEWVLPRESGRELLDFKLLDDSIAYVALNSFADNKIVELFDSVYADIKNTNGLIIDLRNNGGGSSNIGYAIIDYLTDEKYTTSMWRTREHRAAFKAWGYWRMKERENMTAEELLAFEKRYESAREEEREWYDRTIGSYTGDWWYHGEPGTRKSERTDIFLGDVVILLGNNTASAAEDFLVAMDMLERGTFIGERSFGSTGQPLMVELPGGGWARICTKRDTYPDGREFVGYGIKPHVKIKPGINDVLENLDVVLEKGIEVLKEMMGDHRI